MIKPYSELSVAIDLIQNEYKTSNPIIIAEKLKEIFGMSYTIHQISDYLDISEDFELESQKVYYQINY
jgi:hypothetical protein